GLGVCSGCIAITGAFTVVNIGGSLLGGTNSDSGAIHCGGGIFSTTVGHNVQGGSGAGSGFIHSNGFGAVHIGGSLLGGTDTDSGATFSDAHLGMVTIGRDVKGDAGFGSGRIQSGSNVLNPGNLAGVHIFGSLIGGSNLGVAGSLVASGGVLSYGNMGAVKIGHDLIGGTGFSGH